VQIRLSGFTRDSLGEVGRRVRDIYASVADNRERVTRTVDDAYLGKLSDAVVGSLGGQVGIAPRVFLKKLVADVLDRVDVHPDFDPLRHYALTLSSDELTDIERNAAARGTADPDEIKLDL
jgi:hypothetical protein